MELFNNNTRMWLVDDNRNEIASVDFPKVGDRTFNIHSVDVAPEYKGQGIGEDPLDFNLKSALKRGKISVNETLFTLLTQIGKTGSIRRACEEVGISYTKAWAILKDARSVLGKPLLMTQSGGSSGGGALLTEAGQRLIRSYDAFCGDIDKYAAGVFGKYFEWITESDE